jgi:hypothetical protein
MIWNLNGKEFETRCPFEASEARDGPGMATSPVFATLPNWLFPVVLHIRVHRL